MVRLEKCFCVRTKWLFLLSQSGKETSPLFDKFGANFAKQSKNSKNERAKIRDERAKNRDERAKIENAFFFSLNYFGLNIFETSPTDLNRSL